MVAALRLRETTTDTSLRSTTGEAGLRSDGFVVPAITINDPDIDAVVTGYNTETAEWTVEVEWSADEEPDSSTPSSGTNIAEVQIRYSWEGPPEYWSDGSQLMLHNESTSAPSPVTHTGISRSHSISNWLYYSMFYKRVDTNGANYMERVMTTSVLIPNKYSMESVLWGHIPSYYRALDGEVSVSAPNPLERFMKVFGWEADYFRSLIDEFVVLKDPYRVHYNTLTRLADSVGLPFAANELRPSQMRELIYDSHRHFTKKGRADALIDLLSVITDSSVSCREFSTTGAAASAYQRVKITATASRLNLVTNPRFVGTPSSSGTWNYLSNATAGSITVDHSAATGVTLSTDGSGAGTVYLFPRKTVQVKRSVPYYSSVAGTLTNATAKFRLYREEPTNAGSLPPQSTYFVSDDTTSADYYKTLTSDVTSYLSGKVSEKPGHSGISGFAETHAVYTIGSTPVNGSLFRARLYTDTDTPLSAYSLKLTRVDANPASGSRFDRFDLAVSSGSVDVITANNLTVNTSNQVIDEDTSAVVTKLTATVAGIVYTLLVDDVATIAYAATTQLPSDDTSTFGFRSTGVEQLFPVIEVTLANNSSVTLDKWIFQPFSDGDYFDGTTLEGYAYLLSGSVFSDFYWSGTVNDSVSIYTPIRTRNRAAIRKALVQNLPVTLSAELTSANYASATQHGHFIAFDTSPGDEQAFDPHSWTTSGYTEGTIQTNTD